MAVNSVQKTVVYLELLQHTENISSWVFLQDRTLLTYSGSAEYQQVLSQLFLQSALADPTFDPDDGQSGPAVGFFDIGLLWGVCYTQAPAGASKDEKEIYILGPVRQNERSREMLKKDMESWRSRMPSEDAFLNIIDILYQLPVLGYSEFCRHLSRLNYCLNGELTPTSQIRLLNPIPAPGMAILPDAGPAAAFEPRNESQLWISLARLLRRIEDGTTDYTDLKENLIRSIRGTALLSSPESARTLQITLATLCLEAARRGGLPFDTLFALGNAYLQEIQTAQNTTAVLSVITRFIDDLTGRLQQIKISQGIPRDILECCSYIDIHITEDLTAESLASRYGYSTYYFTQRFQNETHQKLGQYIRAKRIEYAKQLLSQTTEPISAIAEQLHMCSRTYFTDVFKQETGMTPSEYRQNIH